MEDTVGGIVAANIRRLREASDRPLSDLCEAGNVSRSYWSEVERGLKEPTVGMLGRFAKALGVPLRDLLEPPPKKRRKAS